MSGGVTANYGLNKPNFDQRPWDQLINGNFDLIDSILGTITQIPSIGGTWKNSTAYTVGQNILDASTVTFYTCVVAHTSAATGTFAADRTANPSYWSTPQVLYSYLVQNNTDLKNLNVIAKRVTRGGYASLGDGGSADFTYMTTPPTPADDGVVVKSNIFPGYWVADIKSEADIRLWGAQQNANVDAALDKAIAWAGKTHIPITLPYPTNGQQYLVATSHVFGNGSQSQLSSVNNITFRIVGGSPENASGTTPPQLAAFRYVGSDPNVIPFVAQGPALGISFDGVGVDCNNVALTGIKLNNIMNGVFRRIAVQGHRGPGIICTVVQNNTWQGALEGCRFSEWWVTTPGPGGCGIFIGDITSPGGAGYEYAVTSNIWENITVNYDASTPGTYGLFLSMATQNLFVRVRSTRDPVRGGTQGTPLKIAYPPGDKGWPTDNLFILPYFEGVVDPGASDWAPYNGQGITFINYNTLNSPFPVSAVFGNYRGNDSAGNQYPIPALTAWNPTDRSGAGLSLGVGLALYDKRGKDVVVELALVYPSNASDAAAAISLPFPVFSTGVSVSGGPITYTDIGVPITAVVAASQINLYKFDGSGVANSLLAGKTVRMSLRYRTT